MNERRLIFLLMVVVALAALGLGSVNLWFGALNQDEGWYLYAARLVAEGQHPYLDFASTQGPVLPYVYALAWPLVEGLGVAGGRLFTFGMGVACWAAAAVLAARLAGARVRGPVALTALALVGINVFQSYFSTMVKTYALAGLLLVLGCLALSSAWQRRSAGLALASAVLFVLAAGTRLSAVFVLPVVFTGLLVTARRGEEGTGRMAAGFLVGGVLAGAALYGPFLVKAPQAVWFALYEYHAGREVGGGLTRLAYKAGFVSRVVFAYLPAVALGAVLWLAGRGRAREARRRDPTPVPVWIGTSVVVITVVHMLAPFPYDDYQAMVYPLFAVLVAVGLGAVLPDAGGQQPVWPRLWPCLSVVLVCLLYAGSSPMLQSWFIGERDRIWWPLRKQTPLAVLRDTARFVRSVTQPGDLLLTQDPYLAVEAGLKVPRGLELGPFSYFPAWSERKARACHVLNRAMFHRLLAQARAPVAAFSGYGLAIRCPDISPLGEAEQEALWSIVKRRYRPLRVVEPFGQADTRLRVLALKDANDKPRAAPQDEAGRLL